MERKAGSEVGVKPNAGQELRQVERGLKRERRRSLGWGRSLRWVMRSQRKVDAGIPLRAGFQGGGDHSV